MSCGWSQVNAREAYLHATDCYRVAEFLLIWPKEKLYGGAIRNVYQGRYEYGNRYLAKSKKTVR
jgi:hypothetical protein